MSDNVFSGIVRNQGNHFLAHFRASVFLLIRFLRGMEVVEEAKHGSDQDVDPQLTSVLRQFPFLVAYLHDANDVLPDELVWDDAADWWRQQIEDWERPRRGYLPLGALSRYANLSFAHRIGLMCAGLVEEDARFGDLFAHLLPGTGSRRVTVEFIGQFILDLEPSLAASPRGAVEPLIDLGLLQLRHLDAAYAERPVAVPEVVWQVIRDGARERLDGWCEYLPRRRALRLKWLAFADEFRQELLAVPLLLWQAEEPLLIVRGVGGSDRTRVVRGIARSLRFNVLAMDINAELSAERRALIAPLALLTQAVPMLRVDAAPGETVKLPEFPGYKGIVTLIMGAVGGVDADAIAHSVTVSLPRLGASERALHWSDALHSYAPDDLAPLVQRYLLPGEHIRQVAGASISYARLARRDTVILEDIARAHRHLNRQLLDKLAEPLDAEGDWETLITASSVTEKLRELETRCIYRERLAEHLGAAFKTTANRGVRALFNGPSGTGKTLAARTLAAVLGMDIYRVDLAAIINKYIGETEKNLHEVLSRAEELDVILLLDEGDALMANRTDVSNANDRYANLETNYLLQRLESYQGIVLVTTNLGDNIDQAFQRRMDVAVNFTHPSVVERVRIWKLHLAAGYQASDAELRIIASKGDFTGGQIRNAAILATLLAMEDNDGVVTFAHLRKAMDAEYRKAGSVSRLPADAEPESSPSKRGSTRGNVAAYIDSLRSG